MHVDPIHRVSFDADKLVREHPPHWDHAHKRLVYDISASSGHPVEGEMVFAHWRAQPLPDVIPAPSNFLIAPGVFAYAPTTQPDMVDWHLNFSDPELFVAYGSALLAQDELQVAEHPVLGSIRGALRARGLPTFTVDPRGNPTPVTITGVQRRCVIDTMPNPAAGSPGGLYGNAFARASSERVRAATRPLSPPTISHILAIAAPPGGYGVYSRTEMLGVLTTAYTGFAAARAESERLVPSVTRTVIHTGFWGCGAFGGDRRLMTILQALAADLAGVDIVFWAFDASGVELATGARRWYEEDLRQRCAGLGDALDHLVAEGFRWGVSDGN